MASNIPATVDQYISSFPEQAQQAMQLIRSLIRETFPQATESISYAMPTFKINGHYLVYFAAYKNHIGLYPAPVNEPAFHKAFAPYKTGKGSIQFPLDQPMPTELILKIMEFRFKEILRKTKSEKL